MIQKDSRVLQPEVSVLIFTYNHEPFIVQAVESVLAQRTDFPYEVIISEDCSTDRTRDLVRALQEGHPDRIRLVLSETNQNDNAVLSRAVQLARGDLIATLDGDDYWTSPEKLQRQRDHLRAHPEQSACFHNALVVYDDGSRPPEPHNPENQPTLIFGEDLWTGDPVATCSAMFRRAVIVDLPEWYRTALVGDWPLFMLSADHGPIGYLSDMMAVYRIHARGYWSGQSLAEQAITAIAFLREMNTHFEGRYAAQAQAGIAYNQMLLFSAYRASGHRVTAWRSMAASMRENLRSGHIPAAAVAKMVLEAALPRTYRILSGRASIRTTLRRVVSRRLPVR
jgi:glycosyltransferase involved in cell wall biosynthesis